MEFSQIERGINNFSAASRGGGIKNLTESFIPFLPHPPPCELKNDNSLTSTLTWTNSAKGHLVQFS